MASKNFNPVHSAILFSQRLFCRPLLLPLYGVGFSFFCAIVRVLTSWYAFLLSFFLMLSSISCHCTSIQNSFAFFMLFLISWLIALYFLAPSAVSCLPFLSALRSSHRSSMLVATHGLLTALRLPKISLAYSVNALLKEFTNVSWNDDIIIPNLLFSLARFCSSPEVKFHVFGRLKHGKEKSLSKNFFGFPYQNTV